MGQLVPPPIRPIQSVYVHVPYCVRKCPYCDFFKVARPNPNAPADRVPPGSGFLRALRAEAQAFREMCGPIRTIFIGGGTPSALSEAEWHELLAILHDTFDLSALAEFTVEVNPNSLTPAKAAIMVAGGVNRLSIGVQSFDDTALRFLGRLHDARHTYDAFQIAREAGLRNISLDLIAALGPASGVDEPARTERDIQIALEDPRINPADGGPLPHVSIYTLIVEPGTPFHTRMQAGEPIGPDEDTEAATYDRLATLLPAGGLHRYEVSNFARPGYRCEHNLVYWRNEPYLGLGPGAHGWDGVRTRRANVRDLPRYIAAWDTAAIKPSAAYEMEVLTPMEVLTDGLLMGLRLDDGVDWHRVATDAARASDAGGNADAVDYQARLAEVIARAEADAANPRIAPLQIEVAGPTLRCNPAFADAVTRMLTSWLAEESAPAS